MGCSVAEIVDPCAAANYSDRKGNGKHATWTSLFYPKELIQDQEPCSAVLFFFICLSSPAPRITKRYPLDQSTGYFFVICFGFFPIVGLLLAILPRPVGWLYFVVEVVSANPGEFG